METYLLTTVSCWDTWRWVYMGEYFWYSHFRAFVSVFSILLIWFYCKQVIAINLGYFWIILQCVKQAFKDQEGKRLWVMGAILVYKELMSERWCVWFSWKKKHDLCQGAKGSRKKRSAFNFFFFNGFIFHSVLFLKVIISSWQHEY